MNKLIIKEARVAEDYFETVIVEETESGTIVRTIATVHCPEYADTFLHNAQELAALCFQLKHRFVTCTWCGWRLDYEADGREAAHATANEHALSCKADPRTAQLEQVTAEREAMREALQKLEYIYFAYKMTMVKRCPVCGSPEGDKEHSFDTDCWLAAALKGGKG